MKKYILFMIVLLCSCTAAHEKGNKHQTPDIPQRKITIETTLCNAATNIIDNGENRINNIMVACQKISGMKLSPGEEFSFNNITGRKTANNGYKSAPVLVDGEKSYGIGGGVCQVSTTIYMAAMSGGFEITEHHNHSESVAYAPNGMDATVVYGVKDFCFINNTDDDIYIYAWVENEQVLAKIVLKEKK
ncbi:MAG: factor for cell wall maintenance or synthesis YoaR [Ruminococcaceae bacterium]|nr:factor for cell wall maintenance or synthesis YoaR [Oscillospiraceae bacterium]